MGKKRMQLKDKETDTGNKPGVLDIVEPLSMDKETTLPPEILMMVIKTFAKQLSIDICFPDLRLPPVA